MSPVISFDIAVVAPEVKVKCCYKMADMLNLKSGVSIVEGRGGY